MHQTCSCTRGHITTMWKYCVHQSFILSHNCSPGCLWSSWHQLCVTSSSSVWFNSVSAAFTEVLQEGGACSVVISSLGLTLGITKSRPGDNLLIFVLWSCFQVHVPSIHTLSATQEARITPFFYLAPPAVRADWIDYSCLQLIDAYLVCVSQVEDRPQSTFLDLIPADDEVMV